MEKRTARNWSPITNFHDAAAACVVRTAFDPEQSDKRLTKRTFVEQSDPYAEFNYGMLKPVVRSNFLREHSLVYRENARLSEDFLYLIEFFAAGGTGLLISRPLYNLDRAVRQSVAAMDHDRRRQLALRLSVSAPRQRGGSGSTTPTERSFAGQSARCTRASIQAAASYQRDQSTAC